MNEAVTRDPEVGHSINAAGITTNYHDLGSGRPVLLIHGSGPGVTAWANWRQTLPALAEFCRPIAPDIVGFGYSERPSEARYGKELWLKHLVGFLDALELQEVDIIGNSFGGALALSLVTAFPERVGRVVLMGSVGVPFQLTDATFAPICEMAPSSYVATCGPFASSVSGSTGKGIFYRNSATRMLDILDGTSHTVMIGDRAWVQANGTWAGVPSGAVTRAGSANPWHAATGPAPALVLVHNNWINNHSDSDGSLDDFSSYHRGGANFLFADGSVHYIHNITDPGQDQLDFWALGTRDGDEVLLSMSY